MLNLLAAYEKRNTRQETSVDQDSFGFAGFDLHLRSAILTKPCASSQAVFAKRWAQTQNESADAAPTHILKITELMRNLSYTSTLAASPTIEYSAPQPKQRQTATALRKARPSATKSGKMLASFRLRLMLSPGKGIVQLSSANCVEAIRIGQSLFTGSMTRMPAARSKSVLASAAGSSYTADDQRRIESMKN